MNSKYFDYIIVGAGMSALQLALKLSEDSYFDKKTIAIIDPKWEKSNNKTWCFWEKGTSHWDNIVSKKWQKGEFITKNKHLNFEMFPYQYKMIRSADFYQYILEKLNKKTNFFFIRDQMIDWTENENSVIVKSEIAQYKCNILFDSSPSKKFEKDNKYIKVWQHFKGIEIETKDNCFDSNRFRMMDFRDSYPNSTSFMYILPFTTRKALLEFTFFSPFFVNEKVYDDYIENYIKKYLKTASYQITRVEQGVIPMSTFPFSQQNSQRFIKIGTAGGWVKSSSGYAFKNTESKVIQVIENIKNQKKLSSNLFSGRFLFYDAIFLRVLYQYNELGEQIFEKFYRKNKIQNIFSFLDEKSHFRKEIQIILSLLSKGFLSAFVKYIIKGKTK